MILKEVIVNNFRVFAGTHSFNLQPRGSQDSKRPIILFGGLNGAGKTSLLTAVRLGLYGKQAIGNAIPNKAYENYLAGSVHKSPISAVPITEARIELIFDYARQGTVEEFKVIRSWSCASSVVKEKLGIFRNGSFLEEFNSEQCQAFLNELIPIGVSDLFFFDGEKIADLAEDESGKTLQTAVKKLLGLDIIERLKNDLSLYLKREHKKALPEDIQRQIDSNEKEMSVVLKEKESAEDDFSRLESELLALKKQIEANKLDIDTRGGAWASSRKEEEQQQSRLIAEKRSLEKALLEEMAGAYPLSFAKNSLNRLLDKLKETTNSRKKKDTAALISEKLNTLEYLLTSRLKNELDKTSVKQAINQSFSELINNGDEDIPKHLDLSDTQIAQYEQWICVDAIKSEMRVKELKQQIDSIEKSLENSSLRLERAPEEDHLLAKLNVLKDLKSREGVLELKIKRSIENIRKHLTKAMELNRKIEKLHSTLISNQSDSSAIRHAIQTKELLSEFGSITAERRIKQLESAFIESYKKLARKEDVKITARIDPQTFLISLIDNHGNEINRQEISAGEKQIYAIAILEALAKTSGRKLPIIIDTPLGRLDSKHRNKLVKNYFPTASHQVIILSTDTEIDQDFYQDLDKDISHAFHINFDEKTKSSTATEGYFWKKEQVQNNQEEIEYAF